MRTEKVEIKTGHYETQGILLTPDSPEALHVVLAHGAGGNMHASFMQFYQKYFAEQGYPCLSFNFPYAQAKKKMPDPQPVLTATFRNAIQGLSSRAGARGAIIGGKSMGGRMASYIADEPSVKALIFLGYPLHPPGKTDKMRDEHLYAIKKPMFFASGTKDPFARMDLLTKVIDRIGNYATLHAIEGGGHSFELPKKSGTDPNDVLTSVADAALDWMKSIAK